MRTYRTLGMCAAAALAAAVPSAFAHCDTLDGPVIAAAREALATTNVNPVLAWVKAEAEPEIRAAFSRALAVRGLGPEARELADTYFFETLVRVHRAGEGAPYTGLKPAGRDLGPVIPAADKALETGDVGPLLGMVTEHIRHGITDRFEQAKALRGFDPDDVQAGREYVEKYVTFLHYVEGLHEAASKGGHHEAEAGAEPEHRD